MDKRVILGLIVLSLVFLIGASSCGSQSYGTTTTAPETTATAPATTAPETTTAPATTQVTTPLGTLAKPEIAIKDYAFTPADITITPGTVVIWTNEDSAPHQIVSDTRGIFGSPTMYTGETYSVAITKSPGTYAYHCSLHPSMKGTITIVYP